MPVYLYVTITIFDFSIVNFAVAETSVPFATIDSTTQSSGSEFTATVAVEPIAYDFSSGFQAVLETVTMPLLPKIPVIETAISEV